MTKKVLIIGVDRSDDEADDLEEILEAVITRCQDLDIEIAIVESTPNKIANYPIIFPTIFPDSKDCTDE